MAKITFLGAAGTVTGSKYLIEAGGKRLLVDCGLFEGSKELKQRNWDPCPIDPSTIDWVLLTHAHIDHTGYLPKLVSAGFRGPIYANAATHELCALLLARFRAFAGRRREVRGEEEITPCIIRRCRFTPWRNRRRRWHNSANPEQRSVHDQPAIFCDAA